MSNNGYAGPDSTQQAGRKGLSQRIAERGHVVVVGRITKVDDGGAYVRRACLEDLKRDARFSRLTGDWSGEQAFIELDEEAGGAK